MKNKITKETASRYFENIKNDFGKRHAFIIAISGTYEEKVFLERAIAEWSVFYPEMNNIEEEQQNGR